MSIEEEKDLERNVNLVLKQAADPEAQKTSLKAAFLLFYNKGHRDGYNEAIADARAEKDKRVVVHLN